MELCGVFTSNFPLAVLPAQFDLLQFFQYIYANVRVDSLDALLVSVKNLALVLPTSDLSSKFPFSGHLSPFLEWYVVLHNISKRRRKKLTSRCMYEGLWSVGENAAKGERFECTKSIRVIEHKNLQST